MILLTYLQQAFAEWKSLIYSIGALVSAYAIFHEKINAMVSDFFQRRKDKVEVKSLELTAKKDLQTFFEDQIQDLIRIAEETSDSSIRYKRYAIYLCGKLDGLNIDYLSIKEFNNETNESEVTDSGEGN